MKRLTIKAVIFGCGLVVGLAGKVSAQSLNTPGSNTNTPTASTETTAPAAAVPSQNAATKPYAPGPGTGQDIATNTNNTAADQMAPVIVTGSLIPTTADQVGPTEVAFVTNAQIQNTNSNNLFDALKRIDVSFSGGGNFGQELNNNSETVGESHVAIRNLETLVLLDGNRLTNSPLSEGSAVDINLIPLSFIDHVEVLKDGASTLYGSDAVGGVVNIITRKNFSGAEVYNQYGFAGDKGSYYTDTASIVGGSTTDKASFFAGVEYHNNDEILSSERSIASLPIAAVVAHGAIPPSYYSGTAPGVVQNLPGDGDTLPGRFIVAGSPYAAGAPGYNPAITTPGPIGGINPLTGNAVGLNGTDAQREAELAAAGYIPLDTIPGFASSGNTFLNTTNFGTYSYTPATTEKAFANMDYEFFPKTAVLYGQFLFTHSDNRSNLAPQPIPNIATNITVPANNPYNPFGVPVGLDGTDSTTVRYRTVDAGNRDFEQLSDYFHVVAGVKGDFGIAGSGDSDYHYNVSFGYDREESDYITRNAINGGALQLAVTPLDPTDAVAGAPSMLRNSNGTFVPLYNVFGIGTNNSNATTQAITANLFNDGVAQLYETNGTLSGITPLQLPAGNVSFALGGEFRVEELQITDDGVTQSGEAVGTNPTASFALEERRTYAGFVEIDVPVISPDMKIPGVHSFNVNGSARIEEIAGGANSYISRVNGIWSPLDSDELSVRGNFSQSFIVPTLYSEFGPPTVSSNEVALVDGTSQQFISQQSSPTIPNTTAQNFGGGFTYTPKAISGLTVSADYYNVIQSGGVGFAPYQPEVNSLEALGAASPYAGSFVFANGTHLTTNAAGQINAGNFGTLFQEPTPSPTTQKTSGVDIKIDYVLPWKQWGVFTVGAVGTYLINYTDQNGIFDGPYQNKAGTFTDPNDAGGTPQGDLPKWQVNPYFQYDWGGFDYTLSAQYIPGDVDLGDESPENPVNDYTQSGNLLGISDYYRIDMSMSYAWGKAGGQMGFPWSPQDKSPSDPKDPKDDKDMSGKESLATITPNDWFDGLTVTLGVNNVTDQLPPFIGSSAEDNTDKSYYDIVGRFFFFQVDKKF